MYSDTPWARTTDEIHDLIDALAQRFLLGGPPTDPPPPESCWEPYEAYLSILSDEFDGPNGYDRDALHQRLDRWNIDTPAGLRAALRLVATHAAIAALSWVLDEHLPDAVSCGERVTREDILQEASAIYPESMRLD